MKPLSYGIRERGGDVATDKAVPVLGIRLRKDGECIFVDVEICGDWIEVIRERSDGAFCGDFCHIVEADWIWRRACLGRDR